MAVACLDRLVGRRRTVMRLWYAMVVILWWNHLSCPILPYVDATATTITTTRSRRKISLSTVPHKKLSRFIIQCVRRRGGGGNENDFARSMIMAANDRNGGSFDAALNDLNKDALIVQENVRNGHHSNVEITRTYPTTGVFVMTIGWPQHDATTTHGDIFVASYRPPSEAILWLILPSQWGNNHTTVEPYQILKLQDDMSKHGKDSSSQASSTLDITFLAGILLSKVIVFVVNGNSDQDWDHDVVRRSRQRLVEGLQLCRDRQAAARRQSPNMPTNDLIRNNNNDDDDDQPHLLILVLVGTKTNNQITHEIASDDHHNRSLDWIRQQLVLGEEWNNLSQDMVASWSILVHERSTAMQELWETVWKEIMPKMHSAASSLSNRRGIDDQLRCLAEMVGESTTDDITAWINMVNNQIADAYALRGHSDNVTDGGEIAVDMKSEIGSNASSFGENVPLAFISATTDARDTRQDVMADNYSEKKFGPSMTTSETITMDRRIADETKRFLLQELLQEKLDDLAQRLEQHWIDDSAADKSRHWIDFGSLSNQILIRLRDSLKDLSPEAQGIVTTSVGSQLKSLYDQHIAALRDLFGRQYEEFLDRHAHANEVSWRDASSRVVNAFRQAAVQAIPSLARQGAVFSDMDLDYVRQQTGLMSDLDVASDLRRELIFDDDEVDDNDEAVDIKKRLLLHRFRSLPPWSKKFAARALMFGVNYAQGWLAWQGIRRAALERERNMPKFPLL